MIDIKIGDCLSVLRTMPAESVQTCVTSPPYFGLRDYGHDGQIGLESTPEAFVAKLVDVFAEVRRVLALDGTLWLNLGDSYAGRAGGSQGKSGQRADRRYTAKVAAKRGLDLKPKDLIGIPWMVAFALRADGWFLRADIVWHKPNPMPESVEDRPTKAHEYLFLLSKAERYFYDAGAIREPVVDMRVRDGASAFRGQAQIRPRGKRSGNKVRSYADGSAGDRPADHLGRGVPYEDKDGRRNRRTVWTIATRPFRGAHFATFPPDLVEPCILAGTRPGDTVLDPFCGAGTTGLVASRRGRSFIGIELNPTYAAMATERIRADAPLLFGGAA